MRAHKALEDVINLGTVVKHVRIAAALALVLLCASPASTAQNVSPPKQKHGAVENKAVLWRAPVDIASRNLFYGEGKKQNMAPSTTFTYVKEDLNGTSPKFDVHDENGVKWRVKLGEEARPETVATRLLWAVGYFANEDYFLPEIRVDGMQPVSKKRRKRVRGLLEADGTMFNAELKRDPKGEKKIGIWKWRSNPFTGTREFNGLRVMMAVLNNWDLKDENNAIYEEKVSGSDGQHSGSSDDPQIIYLVSDVGASFGTAGRARHREDSKGNLNSYRRSKFIRKITPDYVDFYVPGRESAVLAVNPIEYVRRLHLRWIGRHIPRADAKWMGGLLAQLSADQIREALRAADYSQEEVDEFTEVIESRITQLNQL